jgi:hypothetical protein
MTEEDIRNAFRAIAHGRVNHPLVEQLAQALSALLPEPSDPQPDPVIAVEEKKRGKRA